MERYPDSTRRFDALTRLAEISQEMQNPRDAIAHYEEAATLRADTPDARRLRVLIADLYFGSNNFSQAELEYGRAVEGVDYDELTERSLLRLASINHMVRKEPQDAIPLYERVAGSTSDPVVRRQALFSISDCQADLFNFDDAIVTLRRIDDPAEAEYVASRVTELQQRKLAQQEAPPEVDWSRGQGE
jgi:tetratricopeptide (TPR) repeat protein